MFPLIPYKRFVISTSLTVEEIVNVISDAILPRHTLTTWHSSTTKVFEGKIDKQGFEIQKIIHNRNSFLPVLYGRIIPADRGSRIEIKLTLNILVGVFSVIWLSAMSGAFVLLAITKTNNSASNEYLWAPFAAIGLFLLMVNLGFGSYAKETEDFITNLFEDYKL